MSDNLDAASAPVTWAGRTTAGSGRARRRRVHSRQVQAASWAASAALHLPEGPATRQRDAYLARLPERLAWIHSHDVLAEAAERIRLPGPQNRPTVSLPCA